MLKLTQAQIDTCFEQAQEQADYLLSLYRLAFPDFDELVSISGHPSCSEETWLYIGRKAAEFDRLHHDGVMPGGLWLNRGFSSSKTMRDWRVSLRGVSVQRKAR